MRHLSKISTEASDSIYLQSIAQNILGKCLEKSLVGIMKLSSIENSKVITTSYIKVPGRQFCKPSSKEKSKKRYVCEKAEAISNIK